MNAQLADSPPLSSLRPVAATRRSRLVSPEPEPFSLRLRTGTRRAHRLVERLAFVRGLLRGLLDPLSYQQLLADLHAVYGALEAGLRHGRAQPLLLPLVRPELFRQAALAADLETYLDPTSIVDLELFGIRWVIQLRGEPGAAGTRWVTSRGSFQLREVPFGGLVAAVDLLGPWLPVDNDALAATLLAPARAGGRGPVAVREVRLGGRSPVVPASTSTEPDHPGRVVRAREHLADGALDATVDLDRDAALLVRANWNPRWRATVDGKAVAPVMVAPTWLAVPVPAGRHQVALRYRPWPWTPPLLVLALLAVLGAGINRPRWRGVGGGRRRGRDPEAPRDS